MARRTKNDIKMMKSVVKSYLRKNENKPHQAFEYMVKEHMENGKSIPYYIKDIHDFKQCSKEMELESKREEEIENVKKENSKKKESIKEIVANFSIDEIKNIYNVNKHKVSKNDLINIHDVYLMIFNKEIKSEEIDDSTVNTFSRILI